MLAAKSSVSMMCMLAAKSSVSMRCTGKDTEVLLTWHTGGEHSWVPIGDITGAKEGGGLGLVRAVGGGTGQASQGRSRLRDEARSAAVATVESGGEGASSGLFDWGRRSRDRLWEDGRESERVWAARERSGSERLSWEGGSRPPEVLDADRDDFDMD